MTTYEDSQSLREGQKQHSKETRKIFSIRAKKNLTKLQTLYCMKFKSLCDEMDWDVHVGGRVLGITPGQCLDVWEFNTPITDEMQECMYSMIGVKLSTIRLDKEVAILKKARQQRFLEVWNSVKQYIPKVEGRKGGLFSGFSSYSDIDMLATIGKIYHPLLGICLKCWRAGFGETQYSLADKINIKYKDIQPTHQKRLYCRTRPCWEKVETKNNITPQENIAFYKTFGISVYQILIALLHYFEVDYHRPNFNMEEIYETINTVELNIKNTCSK